MRCRSVACLVVAELSVGRSPSWSPVAVAVVPSSPRWCCRSCARSRWRCGVPAARVYRAARERCPMLAIRGISDIVGLLRTDAWTKFACASAAAFARAFLRTRPVPVGASLDEPDLASLDDPDVLSLDEPDLASLEDWDLALLEDSAPAPASAPAPLPLGEPNLASLGEPDLASLDWDEILLDDADLASPRASILISASCSFDESDLASPDELYRISLDAPEPPTVLHQRFVARAT